MQEVTKGTHEAAHQAAGLTQLTRSLREPGGPCTKSMEVSESRMERVKGVSDWLPYAHFSEGV